MFRGAPHLQGQPRCRPPPLVASEPRASSVLSCVGAIAAGRSARQLSVSRAGDAGDALTYVYPYVQRGGEGDGGEGGKGDDRGVTAATQLPIEA